MGLYDISRSRDQNWALLDFLTPGVATEHRSCASGSVVIFQHSCSVGAIYYLQPDGASIVYTTNGATPTLGQGTGSNLGMPVSNGSRDYFIPTTGLNVVKVLCPTGSAEVWLGIKSQSGSIVAP